MTDLKKEIDNKHIIFWAFRYALGRMTYAVDEVVEYLIFNWDKMSVETKEQIQKEIREAIKKKNIGMDCDKLNWERILKLK